MSEFIYLVAFAMHTQILYLLGGNFGGDGKIFKQNRNFAFYQNANLAQLQRSWQKCRIWNRLFLRVFFDQYVQRYSATTVATRAAVATSQSTQLRSKSSNYQILAIKWDVTRSIRCPTPKVVYRSTTTFSYRSCQKCECLF